VAGKSVVLQHVIRLWFGSCATVPLWGVCCLGTT
jgi:hypothetical protein